jgi:hypothetical protein
VASGCARARSFEAIQGDIGLRDEVDRRLGTQTPGSRSPPGFSRKDSIHGTSVGEKDDVGHDIGLGKLKGIASCAGTMNARTL